LAGLFSLTLGTLIGLGKSLPPLFQRSNDDVPVPVGGRFIAGAGVKSGPTATLCDLRNGVCCTGPYFLRKASTLAPVAPYVVAA